MAKYDYKKYKILTDPDSPKSQGFAVGDVVRREYYDNPNLIYSLMVVLETGTDIIGDNESAYFIGALIEGDAPNNGELLDFVRTTNLFDEQRSGALYLTASDSDAPYMDVIDGLAKENSLCYPTLGGGDPKTPDSNKYACMGDSRLDTEYIPNEGGVSRIYRISRNISTSGKSQKYGLKISLEKTVEHPQRILVSFKARADVNDAGVPVSFGYTNGERYDYQDTISISDEWKYKLLTFGVDYPAQYQRSFSIDLTNYFEQAGHYVEIAELNIIQQSDVSQFSKGTKTRIGKISGVVDPVFGVLDGYGAYFKNLYATRNVNIAGTLTAGDENGFSSTFYVGKIHKNVILNSMSPSFIELIPAVANEAPPAGIGKAWIVGAMTKLDVQSAEWRTQHIGRDYCFSIWIKAGQKTTVALYQNEYHFKDLVLDPADDWRRYSGTFRIKGSEYPQMFIRIDASIPGILISSPQLEAGTTPSQYQPTDGTLSYVEDYGAWFNKGGIGGTIQNPLLKLNENGSISSRDGSFVINPDGTGHFASGRFRWTKDTIVLQDVTIKWEDFDEQTQEELTPKSVALSGTNVFHYPDILGQQQCEPKQIIVFATETGFTADSRKWSYLNSASDWKEIPNGFKDFLTIQPDGHYWEGSNVLTIRYTAVCKDKEYADMFTVSKQFDGSDAYSIYILSSNGLVFRNSVIGTTLSARVMKGSEDVTDLIPDGNFRWFRTGNDPVEDEAWNNAPQIGKTIEISGEGVFKKAVFDCEVTISLGIEIP